MVKTQQKPRDENLSGSVKTRTLLLTMPFSALSEDKE
jgi:hypothetical protein